MLTRLLDVNADFAVEFDFQLEKRTVGQGKSPTLEMRLPTYVRVIGPSKNW